MKDYFKNISIQKVDAGTALCDDLVYFIENCSWDEVKVHLTEILKNNSLTDWETFFVAVIDGKIVGMVSAMKEDYYPLPDMFMKKMGLSCLGGLSVCTVINYLFYEIF